MSLGATRLADTSTPQRSVDPRAAGLSRFAGRVALVTGAASGIGAATAARLAAEGALVWLADVDVDGSAAQASKLPDAVACAVDVTDAEAVEALVGRVVATSGRLDVLVANAGVTLDAPIWDTSPADLARVLDVNVAGAFACAAAALRHMVARGSGSVVFTASDAGLVGWPGQAAYCASKGAIVALTRAAALDAAPHGVRVNCVCPGFTDTPLVARWIAGSDDPEAARREVAATQPLGRVADPAEIAAAIAYLASDESTFVTGIALPVDGGVTAQ
ncbi:SDR family NAD(P)-dependent oxidoreductase [Capillimicrobium parvum]|uniref:Dihydroanticapsin 7-dehydrogenase n=1 Tax=Capillimicrobium parvum TaxID=2884022 RepID=A0A9E7C089_9ACTN|nr:SDR family NAD(P)-dependent oxidoreductase [Capillimicrobium parvum]UGS35277.1 Dihydroanticapsin 7-dehydrogenase [Capillimicrobium parvum]